MDIIENAQGHQWGSGSSKNAFQKMVFGRDAENLVVTVSYLFLSLPQPQAGGLA